jgi:hypothetical protein
MRRRGMRPPTAVPASRSSCPLALVGWGRKRYRMKFGTRTTWNGMIRVTRQKREQRLAEPEVERLRTRMLPSSN